MWRKHGFFVGGGDMWRAAFCWLIFAGDLRGVTERASHRRLQRTPWFPPVCPFVPDWLLQITRSTSFLSSKPWQQSIRTDRLATFTFCVRQHCCYITLVPYLLSAIICLCICVFPNDRLGNTPLKKPFYGRGSKSSWWMETGKILRSLLIRNHLSHAAIIWLIKGKQIWLLLWPVEVMWALIMIQQSSEKSQTAEVIFFISLCVGQM